MSVAQRRDPVAGIAAPESRSRRWVLPGVVAVVSALVFAVVRPHLVDDTFITLAYARNLAFHGHWGLIAAETSNTATSPLNVLLLAALTLVLRDAVLAAGALFVLCQVALVLALRRAGDRAGLPSWFAPAAVALLTVNPLLLSSIGLEVELGATGIAWLLVFAGERRPVALGVLTGLLALVRLDLVVVALVLFALRRRFWEKAWQSVLAAAAVAFPWFAFSWVVLGSAVPDTVIIKTLQKSWGQWDFGNGPGLYAEVFPLATIAAFLPAALALLAFALCVADAARGGPLWARVRPFVPLVPAGIAHYLAYTRLHVPPYHWYYGPSLVAATLFLAAAATAAVRVPARVAAAVAVAGVVVVSVGAYAADGLPRRFAPLMSNHDATADYERIGPELGRLVGGGTVRSGGEIGVLAYSCGCAIVDLFDDRGAVGPAITEREAHLGALGRALVDVNFRFFDFGDRPIVTDYALVRGDPPPGALAHWTLTSPWAGTQQLYLVRGNGSGA
ncbi:hypothetical protein H4696_003271 [Amycolatopsis lexingtonensis]|uniref:Glycosyltransferase RgtA/B/C/D-like domain-containing protein n=1 Tax=Amycolatopsis lexingtonensis TaxID=218822 RepID=A0ABR9HZ06_9PSEU|nr:hypothetical protein [Amycolatopsis lexingtonensis]MBE1496171.1 hypothetical protein [Amycolatopsis lexingtonensis]